MTRDQVLSVGPLPFSKTTVGRPVSAGPEQTMWRVRSPSTAMSATYGASVADWGRRTARHEEEGRRDRKGRSPSHRPTSSFEPDPAGAGEAHRRG